MAIEIIENKVGENVYLNIRLQDIDDAGSDQFTLLFDGSKEVWSKTKSGASFPSALYTVDYNGERVSMFVTKKMIAAGKGDLKVFQVLDALPKGTIVDITRNEHTSKKPSEQTGETYKYSVYTVANLGIDQAVLDGIESVDQPAPEEKAEEPAKPAKKAAKKPVRRKAPKAVSAMDMIKEVMAEVNKDLPEPKRFKITDDNVEQVVANLAKGGAYKDKAKVTEFIRGQAGL